MIPVVDGNERVDLLHPVLAARVAALCADPRVPGLAVDSAARTYAEQKHLYDGYMAGLPGFNLAANPDRSIQPAYGLPAPRGSWHMQQSNGYAYAVDFNYSALAPEVQDRLEDVAREYLLVRTVPSEQWHYQMAWGDWTTTPTQEDDMTPELKAELARIEQSLTAEVNAAERRILAQLPAKATFWDGLAKQVRAIKTKVGA